MYAVVSSGGKQYRVEAGTELLVEKLGVEPGAAVEFDRVLLVGDGDDVMVGTPLVDGASVTGTVLREERGPKIIIFKFKQKVKYRRRTGHRQDLVRVRIDEISANGKQSKIETAPRAASKPKPTPRATAAAAPGRTPKAPASRAPRARAAAKAAAPAEEKPKRVTRASAAAKDAGATEAKPKRAPRRRAAKPDAGKE